jgi:hypothetical protein
VIALWKGPVRGAREIKLEAGAQGVLLTICGERATRRSTDSPWPVDNATHHFDMAVRQVRASTAGSGLQESRSGTPSPRVLEALPAIKERERCRPSDEVVTVVGL